MAIKERPIIFSADMVRAILAGNKTQTRRVVKFPAILVGDEPVEHDYLACGYFDEGHAGEGFYAWASEYPEDGIAPIKCPYGKPADRLWVRETWCQLLAVSPATDEPIHIGLGEKLIEEPTSWTDKAGNRRWNYDGVVIAYRANSDIQFCDGDGFSGPYADKNDMPCWRPSIHMPRWASRILLEVKAVRVERLQDISEEDAKKEGVQPSTRQIVKYGRGMKISTAKQAFADLWDPINGKRPGCLWNDNPWVWVIEFAEKEGASHATSP